MSKKFIIGSKLFGLGIGAYDLLVFISGHAVAGPITAAGSQRTKETDPCLFCGPVNPSWGRKVLCSHAESFICESATEEDLQSRLSKALFPEQSLQQLREVLGIGQEAESVPATPSELVQYHKALGVHEPHELARLVDEEFTGKAKLTAEELGVLLPAKDKEAKTPEGCRSQGKRLRRLYKKSQ